MPSSPDSVGEGVMFLDCSVVLFGYWSVCPVRYCYRDVS